MIPALTLALLAALPAAEPSRRERGDLAIRARAILSKHCGDCHGQTGNPSRLDVLDFAKMTADGPKVPFAKARDKRSQILAFVEAGIMPPGDRPAPSDDERDALRRWLEASDTLPGYPRAFDDPTTLDEMLRDFERQPKGNQPHLRYLSLAHLVRDDAPPDTLGKAEARIQRALLVAYGGGQVVSPKPVDDTATLLRIDLRDIGWHTPDLFEKVVNLSGAGAARLLPFDLLLLESPDAPEIPRDLTKRYDLFREAAGQARDVPFLKGDWFAAALAGGGMTASPTPLAGELASLKELAVALAKRAAAATPEAALEVVVPEGPEFTDEPIRFKVPAKPAGRPPVTAMYSGAEAGPDPPPFDLAFTAVGGGPGAITDVTTDGMFRLRVRSAAGRGTFRLLAVRPDGSIEEQKVNDGRHFEPGETRLLTPLKAAANAPPQPADFRIRSIVTGLDAGYQHYVLLASDKDADPPTVVRSKHLGRPVWRFLPDKAVPAVRGVVSLHVTRPKK